MQGVSDTAGQETRNINASEINQLLDTVLQSANAKRLGSYVFAGTETTTEPFEITRNSKGEIDNVAYKGNREKIEYNIGPNTNAQVNQTGAEIFMDKDLFGTMIRVRDSLASGAISFARTELDNLESAAQNIRNSIAKAGSIGSTLELSGNRIEQTKLSLRETLASTESADIAETILKLTEQQNIYEASLASSSFIFRTSILDYI
jgi:flagellar hook-associated protein 3 FlgL